MDKELEQRVSVLETTVILQNESIKGQLDTLMRATKEMHDKMDKHILANGEAIAANTTEINNLKAARASDKNDQWKMMGFVMPVILLALSSILALAFRFISLGAN